MTTDGRATEIITELRSLAQPAELEAMARFGLTSDRRLGGISVPTLRGMAKLIGKDHGLALDLWDSGIHEARLLAAMVDDPRTVTEEQMERWAADFDTWDIVDCVCGDLFDKTPFAYRKVIQWSEREAEFVKRAAFALLAESAVHDKASGDDVFMDFLPLIEREAGDPRHYVRKAVNWALRQIGKRNLALNHRAIESALRIQANGIRSARWVASDALRELRSEAVQRRLRQRGSDRPIERPPIEASATASTATGSGN